MNERMGDTERALRVLVTGGGGPSAISFMQAVSGNDVELFAADCDPYASGLYLVPRGNRVIVHRGDDSRFIEHLLAACAVHRIEVLVPTVDLELGKVAAARDAFQAAGTAVLVASSATLDCCLDKWDLVRVCRSVCPTPHSAPYDSSFDDVGWGYPFFVKPRRGAGGNGAQLVVNPAMLGGLPRDGSLIVQEFLTGEEFSVDVLSDCAMNVIAVVPRVRLRINSGIAVCGRTLHDEILDRQARSVARRIGLAYIANIQFRRDAAGVAKLLDVNVRFPGTMPLTIAAGVNMPRLALDLVAKRAVPRDAGTFHDVGMVRVWREHFVPTSEFDELVASAATVASSTPGAATSAR
ncbi:MAG TPA: ATP-grasp domain-containing protein [Gemmatimonadaceae bacterium]|nr:ATP-grasp domain-containing protein [Gemmatimonadaceae bacterium]